MFSLYCNKFNVKTDGNLSIEKKSEAIRIGGDCTVVHFFMNETTRLVKHYQNGGALNQMGVKTNPHSVT